MRTWHANVRVYKFCGRFIPEAQDLAAVKLLIECNVLPAIQAGRIWDAIAAGWLVVALLMLGGGQQLGVTGLEDDLASERAKSMDQYGKLVACRGGIGRCLAVVLGGLRGREQSAARAHW